MNKPRSITHVSLAAAAMLLVAGCGSTPAPTGVPADTPVSQVQQPSLPAHVTFYVAGMNQRLKIL